MARSKKSRKTNRYRARLRARWRKVRARKSGRLKVRRPGGRMKYLGGKAGR